MQFRHRKRNSRALQGRRLPPMRSQPHQQDCPRRIPSQRDTRNEPENVALSATNRLYFPPVRTVNLMLRMTYAGVQCQTVLMTCSVVVWTSTRKPVSRLPTPSITRLSALRWIKFHQPRARHNPISLVSLLQSIPPPLPVQLLLLLLLKATHRIPTLWVSTPLCWSTFRNSPLFSIVYSSGVRAVELLLLQTQMTIRSTKLFFSIFSFSLSSYCWRQLKIAALAVGSVSCRFCHRCIVCYCCCWRRCFDCCCCCYAPKCLGCCCRCCPKPITFSTTVGPKNPSCLFEMCHDNTVLPESNMRSVINSFSAFSRCCIQRKQD